MNNDIKVFDKVIPDGYADAIEEDLLQQEFPWYYIDDVTNPDYGNNSGLSHVVFNHGKQPLEYYPFLKPLVYAIAEANGKPLEQLFRIRIGFLPKTDEPEYEYNTPHVDFFWSHYTACYYVNDSDGPTRFYKSNTDNTPMIDAEAKKGRILMFPACYQHQALAGTGDIRMTVNFAIRINTMLNDIAYAGNT